MVYWVKTGAHLPRLDLPCGNKNGRISYCLWRETCTTRYSATTARDYTYLLSRMGTADLKNTVANVVHRKDSQ